MAQTTKTRGGRSVATKILAILGAGFVLISILVPVASALPVDEGSQVQEQTDGDLSLLVCDTTTILDQDLREGREDMEVDKVEPPSMSPSLSMPCSDPYSNIRGSYSSTMAPCVVTFHNEDAILINGDSLKNIHDEGESDTGVNHKKNSIGDSEKEGNLPLYYQGTSSVCGIDNAIGEVKEYVTNWPDECVGDFARCYNLKDRRSLLCGDLNILLGRLEAGSKRSGVPFVPSGTTHISVDCTIDRQTMIESFERMDHLEHVKIRETVSADKERTLFAVASVLFAVLIVLVAISHLVVQPIVGAILEGQGRRDRNSVEGNQFASLVANNSSGFRLDSDGDVSSLQVEANTVLQENLSPDEMETETVAVSSRREPIQIEADTVPIVSATILPLNIIQAEVIQDDYYEQ